MTDVLPERGRAAPAHALPLRLHAFDAPFMRGMAFLPSAPGPLPTLGPLRANPNEVQDQREFPGLSVHESVFLIRSPLRSPLCSPPQWAP